MTADIASSPSPGARWMPWASTGLAAGAVLVFVRTLASHAVNTPVSDDYYSILEFLLRWTDPAGGGRLHLLFDQFYSHRIPLTRLMCAGLLAVTGHCDLRLLQAVAWTAWLALAASLAWLPGRGVRHAVPALALAALFLLQPQGYTNLLVATGSPGHAGCLLAAFWALHFLDRPARFATPVALGLALVSTACSLNALLLFPLAVTGCLVARQWSRAGIWLVAGGIAWVAYLAGYSVVGQPFAQTGFSPVSLFLNITTMAGAALAFGRLDLAVVILLGTILCAASLGLALRAQVRRESSRDSLFVLFLLGSVLLTAWARLGWPPDYMLQDRYRPYSVLLLALLALQLLTLAPPPRRQLLAGVLLVGAVTFNLLSYAQTWADLDTMRNRAEATAMNLQLGRAVPLVSAPELAARGAEILQAATTRGLIRPPQLLNAASVEALQRRPGPPVPAGATPLRAEPSPAAAGRVIASDHARESADQNAFGVIYQDGRPLVLPLIFLRARLADTLRYGRMLSAHYEFVLPDNNPVMAPAELYHLRRDRTGACSVQWSAQVANAPDPVLPR